LTEHAAHTAPPGLALRRAIALGLLHGPTELLPISSSGHTTLVPWLARRTHTGLDPASRKAFEVALHAGTAAALLVRPPWEGPLRGRLGFLVSALAPPALCGYALGGQIERRLGTPATIASGLLAGSAAMTAAETRARKTSPARVPRGGSFATDAPNPCPRPTRTLANAGAGDGIALGVAQSLALIPGVSRSGATFAAARARGFSPTEADRLSWKVGLPVISGAALLKGIRLRRATPPRELTLPLLAGAASAFASTLMSAKALGPSRRARLIPASIAYRCALALLVIRRMRDDAI
jgi:undecaprenyl-diphosphatase